MTRIDALCRRRCAFALYQAAGQAPRFCMQRNGGTSSWLDAPGFVLSLYNGTRFFLAGELDSPPEAESFAPLLPACPGEPAATRTRYSQLFSLYHSWLGKGRPLEKIVLARTEDIPAPEFSPARAFAQACRCYPHHFNALVHGEWGTWLCSTPEVLLSGQGEEWQTMALAGTRFSPDGEWDDKNKQEHRFVVRHITNCLRSLSIDFQQNETATLDTGNLRHLCTRIHFRMPRRRLLEILHRLPPTPAVCGYPADKARELMAAHPDIERGCYAGYLGPVSPAASHLYVMLRCMQIFPGFCRLYAGGGLMPHSLEPEEWAETEAKMQTMRSLISWRG